MHHSPFYHQSPIVMLPPPPPPPASAAAASATAMDHSVAFGQPISQHTSLSHAFGMSPSTAFALAPALASPSQQQQQHAPWRSMMATQDLHASTSSSAPRFSPLATSSMMNATSLSRRRRRSLSPPAEEGAERQQQRAYAMDGTGAAAGKKMRSVKKSRMEDGRTDGAEEVKQTADLGKALASLSKESLLTLLTTLITTTPSLRPSISALLPQPTLTTTLTTLAELERAVMLAIPSGVGIREDYIWGRIRSALESYVAESKNFLGVICSGSPSAAVVSGAAGGAEDEIGHPSTTFAFLYALTSSLRRIEAVLPSPPSPTLYPSTATRTHQDSLAAHLLPLLINFWHLFVSRLSTSVNQEGRILSAGVLRGWFARLEELCVASPGVSRTGGRREGGARRACQGVRDRMIKEVGWLVGLRLDDQGNAASSSNTMIGIDMSDMGIVDDEDDEL